jgi:hypothetical protein
MKKLRLIFCLITILMIITLAACTAQPVSQTNPTVAATNASSSTPTVDTLVINATAELTATTAPTATLEPTTTPEPTATVEPIANEVVSEPTSDTAAFASGVYLTLAANTICRTGPSTNYQSVTSIPAGQRVLAVGRLSKDSPYYFIENPAVQDTHCWVFGQGVSIEGNLAELMFVEPLPSPTPITYADFSVTYSNIKECADDYSFRFFVENTDKTIWHSIKVYIVDVNTKQSASYSSNRFEESVNCHLDNYQEDLAEGERVFITPFNPGHFDYRPYGGTFLLKVTLCTKDDFAGTCLTREIKVQP